MTIDHGVSIPFVPMSAATVRTVCVFSSLLFSRRFSFFPWGWGRGRAFLSFVALTGANRGFVGVVGGRDGRGAVSQQTP